MTLGIRTVLTALAVAFTAYLAVGALVWTVPPEHPLLLVSAVAVYLAVTWLCTFWNVRRPPGEGPDAVAGGLGGRSVLPRWAAALSVLVAAVVPSASWSAAGESARLESFATWSLGGIGAMMSIVMVRRRPWAAWVGVALVAISATAWIGLSDALALGLVGAVLWVGVAQLATRLVERAARDTAELTGLERAASEWLASQEGMRRERRTHIRRALAVGGPILVRTIESEGDLDEEERVQARVAEGSLRDDLRGPALLDDLVRERLAAVRRRGAAVSVLDEGGLDGMVDAELLRIRRDLAAVLAGATSERLYIRASRDESIAVTVVGRSAGDDSDGSVDLWHEIPRLGDGR
ncbi:hypothetical protein [Microbacterium sp.]|uniref:hypothetical protein n=1 Tax=Microbacterium sp. TaxID=51671 RepID=UPI0025D95BFD|nr:hypothetical protein [Microbacterium sp.]